MMWWEQGRLLQTEGDAENPQRRRKIEWAWKDGWMLRTERNSTWKEQWVRETWEGERSIRYRVENNWTAPDPGKGERTVSNVTREDTALSNKGTLWQCGRRERRKKGLQVWGWKAEEASLPGLKTFFLLSHEWAHLPWVRGLRVEIIMWHMGAWVWLGNIQRLPGSTDSPGEVMTVRF